MSNWLGVVSAEHVRRAVSLGIGQIAHGKRPPLARMRAGDWFLYYSPRERISDGTVLKQFTAIGVLSDDEIWQADEGTFQPWRRRVDYLPATPVGVAEFEGALELTSGPSWGIQLRRGLVELSDVDLELIRSKMTA